MDKVIWFEPWRMSLMFLQIGDRGCSARTGSIWVVDATTCNFIDVCFELSLFKGSGKLVYNLIEPALTPMLSPIFFQNEDEQK